MKTRPRRLWILLGCGIAVVLILMLWREREPRYNGRSLSEWVRLLRGGYSYEVDVSPRDAEEAIRGIGTNGLPFLLKWLNYRQRFGQTRLGAERQQDAFSALYVLGDEAKPAIPALTNLFAKQPDLADQSMAALIHIGDEGLSQVLRALTNPASPVRAAALYALADPGANYTFNPGVAAVLTSCLADSDPLVAFRSAEILCMRHVNQEGALRSLVAAIEGNDKRRKQEAVSFLPDVLRRFYATNLVQFLQDRNSVLSPYAAAALGYKFEDSKVVPPIVLSALTNSLNDPRPLVRSYAADAMGQLGTRAEPFAFALLGAWNDPDESVRQAATNAFFALPAYTVLKAVAQWPQLPMAFRQQMEMYRRRYGLPSQRAALASLLNHQDVRVREMATNALQKLEESNPKSRIAEKQSR